MLRHSFPTFNRILEAFTVYKHTVSLRHDWPQASLFIAFNSNNIKIHIYSNYNYEFYIKNTVYIYDVYDTMIQFVVVPADATVVGSIPTRENEIINAIIPPFW